MIAEQWNFFLLALVSHRKKEKYKITGCYYSFLSLPPMETHEKRDQTKLPNFSEAPVRKENISYIS